MNIELTDLPPKYRKQAEEQLGKVPKAQKPNKYGNIKTESDGHIFDSRKEANYFDQLKLRMEAGEIRHLVIQPRYELQPAFDKDGKHNQSIEYVADFEYIDVADGKTYVIDVKGKKTPVYNIKRKMFEYRYQDLHILEV